MVDFLVYISKKFFAPILIKELDAFFPFSKRGGEAASKFVYGKFRNKRTKMNTNMFRNLLFP